MLTQSEKDTLQAIANTTHSLLNKIQPIRFPPHRLPPPDAHVEMPHPQPIMPSLISEGLNLNVAEQLSHAYLKQAILLKKSYDRQLERKVQAYFQLGLDRVNDYQHFLSVVRASFATRYARTLREWQESVARTATAHSTGLHLKLDPNLAKPANERRYSFKHENVPTLEKAFSLNAYPSRSDKELLAVETGMEYKQVNIWFQNRRARSKKENLTLKKATSPVDPLTGSTELPSTTSCPENQAKISTFGSMHRSDNAQSDNDESEHSPHPVTTSLHFCRPPYAFPTPYPPLFEEDPFPVRKGTGLFDTPWPRRGKAPHARPSASDAEIGGLVDALASMSLSSDDAEATLLSPLRSFEVVPPRAPLPSLICTATTPAHARPVTTYINVGAPSPPLDVPTTHTACLPPKRRAPSRICTLPVALDQPLLSSTPARSPPRNFRHKGSQSPRRRASARPSLSRSSSVSSVASSSSSSGPLTPTSPTHSLGVWEPPQSAKLLGCAEHTIDPSLSLSS